MLAVIAAMVMSGLMVLVLVGFAAWRQRESPSEPAEENLFVSPVGQPVKFVPRPRTRSSPAQLRSELDQLATHAAAVSQDAALADASAAAAWDRCAMAERAREQAWQVYDAAQRSFDEARRQALAGRGSDTNDGTDQPAGTDDGQRQVSRAALAAYHRGELSVEQLRELFRRAGGWDPAQQEREQEAERRESEWRGARRAYEHTAAVERAARQVAHVAEVAAQALAEEAADAAVDADEARAVIDKRQRPNSVRG
jgi:hypothetical protein